MVGMRLSRKRARGLRGTQNLIQRSEDTSMNGERNYNALLQVSFGTIAATIAIADGSSQREREREGTIYSRL